MRSCLFFLAPYVYPNGLKGWGTKKTNMEITWQVTTDVISF